MGLLRNEVIHPNFIFIRQILLLIRVYFVLLVFNETKINHLSNNICLMNIKFEWITSFPYRLNRTLLEPTLPLLLYLPWVLPSLNCELLNFQSNRSYILVFTVVLKRYRCKNTFLKLLGNLKIWLHHTFGKFCDLQFCIQTTASNSHWKLDKNGFNTI